MTDNKTVKGQLVPYVVSRNVILPQDGTLPVIENPRPFLDYVPRFFEPVGTWIPVGISLLLLLIGIPIVWIVLVNAGSPSEILTRELATGTIFALVGIFILFPSQGVIMLRAEHNQWFVEQLEQARRHRLVADDDALRSYAELRHKEVIKKSKYYEHRTDDLWEGITHHHLGLLYHRYDEGGREILDYFSEGRRLVQLARTVRSAMSPGEEKLHKVHDKLMAVKAHALGLKHIEIEQARLEEKFHNDGHQDTL